MFKRHKPPPFLLETSKPSCSRSMWCARMPVSAFSQTPHHATLKALFKKYEPAGARLMFLIDALAEATHIIDAARPKTKGNQQLVSQIWKDRESLMPQLDSWRANGVVDAKEVERIHAGTGSMDAARDVLAVAAIVKRLPDRRVAQSPTRAGLRPPGPSVDTGGRAA